jgi:hypothetical protein
MFPEVGTRTFREGSWPEDCIFTVLYSPYVAIAFTQLHVNAVRAADDHTLTVQSFLAEAREAQSRKDFSWRCGIL